MTDAKLTPELLEAVAVAKLLYKKKIEALTAEIARIRSQNKAFHTKITDATHEYKELYKKYKKLKKVVKEVKARLLMLPQNGVAVDALKFIQEAE